MTDLAENVSSGTITGNHSSGPAGVCSASPGRMMPVGVKLSFENTMQSIPPWTSVMSPFEIRRDSVCSPLASVTVPTFTHAM